MAWNIVGTYWAPCSCRVGCPCALGEKDADRGWCSGAVIMDIRNGRVSCRFDTVEEMLASLKSGRKTSPRRKPRSR